METAVTTSQLVKLASLPAAAIPASARRMAHFSLFDWMVVGRAGAGEPVAAAMRRFVADEGGTPAATVFGAAQRVPARAAALANGAISHALDYDDTHFAHIGHLSVGVLPAALAVAEQLDLSAAEACDAFLLGAEAACRVGVALGRQHYERGFHQTATAGAFGATVAAGRLLGLNAGQMRHALSLTATRASGLKCQFGTMGKPFNAGIAAANGVESALLANLGLTSCDDGIGGVQGFMETHSAEIAEAAAWASPPPHNFVFEDIAYKLHACCHGTHAMLNALAALRREGAPAPAQLHSVTVRTNPRWLRVCDIKAPRTGLEVKFSYVWLAAMCLHGIDTAADRTYADALCSNPTLAATAAKVMVEPDPALTDSQAVVTLQGMDGLHWAQQHDLGTRLSAAELERGLRSKAAALLGNDAAMELWRAVADIDRASSHSLAWHLAGDAARPYKLSAPAAAWPA